MTAHKLWHTNAMSEQLSSYISEQINAGVPTEKIKAALKKSGWKDTAVLDALAALKGPTVVPGQPSKIGLYIGVFLILLALVGGGVFAFQRYSNSTSISVQLAPSTEVPVMEEMPESISEMVSEQDMYGTMDGREFMEESTHSAQTMIVGTDYAKMVEALAADLPSCSPRKISFTHFFDGTTQSKEIIGQKDKGCFYTETLPNGGKFECYFSDQQLTELTSSLLEEMDSYSENQEEGSLGFSYSSTESATANTNAWQNVYNDSNVCTLSGYGS